MRRSGGLEINLQSAMISSDGQPAVAGALLIFQAQMPQEPSISAVAGYAGVGGAYSSFGIWVSVNHMLFRPRFR